LTDIIPRPGLKQAARCTVAAAALADDYQRATESADVAERAMWAARLADMLGYVLAAIGTETRRPPRARRRRRPSGRPASCPPCGLSTRRSMPTGDPGR
jgi:hypothetical protein